MESEDVSDLNDVTGRVKALLAQVLGEPGLAATIGDDAGIVTDLGLDSIQMINFLLQVEDEFDVELDFESLDLDHLGSVRRFCAFVASLDPQAA
jgi:acyl carrier protein